MRETPTQDLLGRLNAVEERFAPKALYYSGDAKLLRMPRVSVVGTRKPSPEGIERASSWTRELVSHGVCIVSGLALGVDTVAHKTAISSGGRTISVIGSPLDQYAPPSNRALQEEIGNNHLLISQFAPGTKVFPGNFPKRNRTMALCSHATVIVEAGEESGTEHQGWEALRLGRGLFLSEELAELNYPWVQKLIDYGAVPISELSIVYDYLPLRSSSAEYSLSL